MFEINRNNIYEEKFPNNSFEILELKTQKKISLRKNKNYIKIQKIRGFNLEHSKVDLNSHIKPEQKFKINKFEQSFSQIFSYLNSNDIELVKYCIDELRAYFIYNNVNQNEQKIIIDNNFLNILLNIGQKFLLNNDLVHLSNLLWILINIQIFEKGSNEYLQIMYTDQYFNFYNNCLISTKNDHIFNTIRWILDSLYINNDIENLNLKLLRSDVFISLLDYFKNQNKIEIEDKELTLKIINYGVNINSLEECLNEKDIKIINRCLTILIKELYGTSNEVLLSQILKGIYQISTLNDNFGFNKRIINEGVTSRLLNFKFNSKEINNALLKMIIFILKILANNLVLPDEDCKLIYELNIIDYYNDILVKFDYYIQIVIDILYGLKNISLGKNRDIIKLSKIWEHKIFQKYCNLDDKIKKLYLYIIKFFTLDKDYEKLKFIYDTKILEYFIYLFRTSNISQKICTKIIIIIDNYLSKFNIEYKKNNEYLIIYQQFCDLFQSCEKINKLSNLGLINAVAKNIQNNYN